MNFTKLHDAYIIWVLKILVTYTIEDDSLNMSGTLRFLWIAKRGLQADTWCI